MTSKNWLYVNWICVSRWLRRKSFTFQAFLDALNTINWCSFDMWFRGVETSQRRAHTITTSRWQSFFFEHSLKFTGASGDVLGGILSDENILQIEIDFLFLHRGSRVGTKALQGEKLGRRVVDFKDEWPVKGSSVFLSSWVRPNDWPTYTDTIPIIARQFPADRMRISPIVAITVPSRD